ncbi:porin [bacterium]|nr:porin [bacterium]
MTHIDRKTPNDRTNGPAARLPAAVCAILFASASLPLPSAAATTFAGPAGGTLTFYGQIGTDITRHDDGAQSYTHTADNPAATSILGLTYDRALGPGKLQLRFETGLGIALTKAYSQRPPDPATLSWTRKQLRFVEISYQAGFGKIAFGQGSMATDGAGNIDDSGTKPAGYAGWDDVAGGYLLRHSDGTLSPIRLGAVFHNTDGPRRFRLRYDTPMLDGFTLALAYGKEVLDTTDHNRYYDAAVRWKGDLAGMTVDAALGYAWTDPRGGGARLGQSVASVSIVHPDGLNLTLGAGKVQHGLAWDYAKLGYGHRWFAVGKTAVAAEYFHARDYGADNGHGRGWGLLATQSVEKYNLTLYAGIRRQSYSDSAAAYLPARTYSLGVLWAF